MVSAARLDWLLGQVYAGRQCRLRLNTYADRIKVHIVLLPNFEPEMLNSLVATLLLQMRSCLDEACVTDHGHKNSVGDTFVTFTLKKLPGLQGTAGETLERPSKKHDSGVAESVAAVAECGGSAALPSAPLSPSATSANFGIAASSVDHVEIFSAPSNSQTGPSTFSPTDVATVVADKMKLVRGSICGKLPISMLEKCKADPEAYDSFLATLVPMMDDLSPSSDIVVPEELKMTEAKKLLDFAIQSRLRRDEVDPPTKKTRLEVVTKR